MRTTVGAIDKIIARRSLRDYQAALKKLTEHQRAKYAEGGLRISYSLGSDTQEAIDVKHDYLDGRISEEEYKAYCLKQNLLGI